MKTQPKNYDSPIKEKRLKKFRDLLIGEIIVYSPWVKSYKGLITEIDECYSYLATSPHYGVTFFDIENNKYKQIIQTCFQMNRRVHVYQDRMKKTSQND